VSELATVFSELRKIMARHAGALEVKYDDDHQLYLDTRHLQKNKKPLFFGAVQMNKSYVSYHLMPVYMKPELLASISPQLKARMQGKSCFNFKASEPALFKELAVLTKSALASYKAQGFV
jgi:hypothetical protein